MKSVSTASPLVSVIIPAYNAEAFIQRTLTSVLSQTYKNLEVLVIDDGSTDRTVEIVQAMAEGDRRIHLLQQPNSGVAAARNLGIKHAKGEFIAPLDADDIWYPQNIEKQVQCFLTSDETVGLVYSWSVDIDEKDVPTGEFRAANIGGYIYKALICHNFLGNASASLIRRTCLEKVGYYNQELRKQGAEGCEDWDLYLRIAEYYQFRAIPEFLIGYRKISSSMSGNFKKMARSHALMLQTVQNKHPEMPTLLYRLSSSSFYMYLARQSSQYGNDCGTLFWLVQALKADYITPLIRYGLYTLSLKSLLRLSIRSMKSIFSLNSPDQIYRRSGQSPHLISIAELQSRHFSIKFKLFAGHVLHRLLLAI
ncbi:glycosyltransferase family 2 protein [Leptolyngbya sp. FACHB-541]|uniref:glycosyltransferase family 2 protein n=1 Tax=Leptolyngbya sp. FACHB-541 TaxID=2692810 RepID=UPI001687797D|nr:glycosyltransferase family A protein [Leptolyngbya sp. FACHB-541]MBD1995857.1 glycosyltransferase family 2 protein [Leptolyngbya sp. FACHB-541]